MQSVVESAASARGMTVAAAARAASLQDAHASVARLTEQMDGMEARCIELASQLAEEKTGRQVATREPWAQLPLALCWTCLEARPDADQVSHLPQMQLTTVVSSSLWRSQAVTAGSHMLAQAHTWVWRRAGRPGSCGGRPAAAAGAAERSGAARRQGASVAGGLLAVQVRGVARAGRSRAQRRRLEGPARCRLKLTQGSLPGSFVNIAAVSLQPVEE